MTLDNLVGRGLEQAPANKDEISRYLAKIRRKIADCKQKALSLDTRFDTAFAALLQIALAALRANGYRTTSEAAHQRVAAICGGSGLSSRAGENAHRRAHPAQCPHLPFADSADYGRPGTGR